MATSKKVAKKLPKTKDQKNSKPRVMVELELMIYNKILKAKGEEAAKAWLNEQWA